jgi:large-conductance mechanosensitive channel
VTDGPFCSPHTEIPLNLTALYLPLFLATALVGGLAAILVFSSEVQIITHTLLGEVVSHLLYGSFMLSIVTFYIIATCSYTMQLVGHDLQHHWPIIWLPLATLMVTTITVVLAAQLWYINHHSHPGTASVTMAITFLVIALIPIFMEMDRLPHLPQMLREKKTEEGQPA